MTVDLIKALQYISPWYRNPDRERPSNFPAGLTFAEIEQKTSVLPFQLPIEVYEIYQWCNGSKNPEVNDEYDNPNVLYQYEYDILIVGEATFLDLDTAIDIWSHYDQQPYRSSKHESPIFTFPLMTHENGAIVIVGDNEQRLTSPIWDIDSITDELRNPAYPSISNMMTAIAEAQKKERELWAASEELGYFDDRALWNACEEIRETYGS